MPLPTKNTLSQQFSLPLLQWFDLFGRKDLPWQHPRDPYRVWISEIMLQQTQVQTVIPYFLNFMQHFPSLTKLAQASDDEVLSLWSGLGYYSRARNLRKTAQIIAGLYQGVFPQTLEQLIELPGIGQSTAAAILSQAFNQAQAILDGNVKRVLTRFFLIEGLTEKAHVKKQLWDLAQVCMHTERCADYTQAIMDLGATCCTLRKPACTQCPLKTNCQAFKHSAQHLYPTKKPKKVIPIHHQQFLVLRQNDLIYLEKRPPTGLWGGLWCLPSLDSEHCPLEFIKKEFSLLGNKPLEITSFKHQFSHFHLNIKALSILVEDARQRVAENKGKWLSLSALPSLGLAKPTSLILSKL